MKMFLHNLDQNKKGRVLIKLSLIWDHTYILRLHGNFEYECDPKKGGK